MPTTKRTPPYAVRTRTPRSKVMHVRTTSGLFNEIRKWCAAEDLSISHGVEILLENAFGMLSASGARVKFPKPKVGKDGEVVRDV